MNSTSAILEQAAAAVIQRSSQRPASEQVQQALLAAEKVSKQQKTHYSFSDLLGHWRLCFITGTRKTRKRAGVVLGAGRYVPSFVTISLIYAASPDEVENSSSEPSFEKGTVINQVKSGPLQIALSGPVKLLEKNNILAFDFTQLALHLSQLPLYRGAVRGGETSAAKFYQDSVGQQAFFNYFLVQKDIIAARGRGGGLALWGRQE